ncbi:DUF4232 domain-containing protein [Streptomyces sp. NPDC101132]|uniref:DUF4232 domain-containing protein n=1 Tax=Streptomyces sp. NPDC101132 TaxID=3366110 RepID=UPI0037FAFA4C
MHSTRRGGRNLALGAVAVAALLSTTACTDGAKDDARPGTRPATQSPSAPAGSGGRTSAPPADPGGPGPSASGGPGSPTAPAGSPKPGASGGPGGGKDGKAACTSANISIATTFYRQDSGRHMLLTATNTGKTPCTLYRYPFVRFGDGAQDPIGPLESDWHAVATIRPGGKAYAGMRLFRAGEQVDLKRKMTVGFVDRDGELGTPLNVPLPEPTFVDVGPTPGVTYWNTSESVVNRYMFAT